MKSWLEKKMPYKCIQHITKENLLLLEDLLEPFRTKFIMSKNMYIYKLDDIVNKYNNAYYRTIKMKPVDVKSSTYLDFNKENNNKGPKFKVDDNVRISKCQHIFVKGYTPNWSEEVFVIKKVKNTVPWIYAISNLDIEEIVGTFCRKREKY